jgi:hypothetical protein
MANNGSAPRGWGKAPRPRDDGKDEDPSPTAASSARALASEVGAAVRGRLAPVAGRVGAAMESGVSSVERALADPTGALTGELLAQADLPELGGDDPLASLALRLDREADLWRGVAMRQFARAAWMERLSMIGALISVVGVLLLAAIAGFRALFSADHAGQAAVLVAVGALLSLSGMLALGRVSARVRAGQVEAAREALERADLAEARLHRLAALLSMRNADAEAYKAALRELESDMRAG